MEGLSFDRFVRKIHIHAPMHKIYDLWTTEEGICKWFLRKSTYYRNEEVLKKHENVKAGDIYVWEWHNFDGDEKGEVLKANGKDIFEFTFFMTNKVLVELFEDKEATLVKLTQYNIPTDTESSLKIHYGCSNGWSFWLTNLKAYLEHGVLLNETQIDLRDNYLNAWEMVNI